jgi:pentatricopeptide repeat protein
MGIEAVDLYRKMPDHLHHEVSHICVLNACSHSGLLGEARSIFSEIHIKTKRITTTMVYLSSLFIFIV